MDNNKISVSNEPQEMSSHPVPTDKTSELPLKQNVPVQITDFSMFDNSFAFMREQFNQEMKRVEHEMLKFSNDLSQYFNAESSAIQTGLMTSIPQSMASRWEALENSPLVTGEEKDKILKLQFDLSQFSPSEIKVKILNDMLIVSASHEEITKDRSVYREYSRQFKLPPGTNPELVVSSLSQDGVLSVEAPLSQPKYIKAHEE